MSHERFMVPEALFHPSDLGIEQAGVHEAIWSAVSAAPAGTHAVLRVRRSPPAGSGLSKQVTRRSLALSLVVRDALLQNVRLIGGNAGIPGMARRVYVAFRQAIAPCNAVADDLGSAGITQRAGAAQARRRIHSRPRRSGAHVRAC